MGDIQYNGVTINVVMQAVSSTRMSMFADNVTEDPPVYGEDDFEKLDMR